jgi:hypothetical protein
MSILARTEPIFQFSVSQRELHQPHAGIFRGRRRAPAKCFRLPSLLWVEMLYESRQARATDRPSAARLTFPPRLSRQTITVSSSTAAAALNEVFGLLDKAAQRS